MTNKLDRRQLLARAVWTTAGGAAIATTGLAQIPRPAVAAGKHSPSFDVACLFNTFTPILAPGADPDDPDAPFTNWLGTTFFVEGDLYPAGTIPGGATDFDPEAHNAMGHWLCRGWFINRTGRSGLTDRPDPHVVTQQEYLLGKITASDYFPADQLASSGLEGDREGRPVTRSVIGGAGSYHGARGSVVQHTTGANTTGGPNFRFDFSLAK